MKWRSFSCSLTLLKILGLENHKFDGTGLDWGIQNGKRRKKSSTGSKSITDKCFLNLPDERSVQEKWKILKKISRELLVLLAKLAKAQFFHWFGRNFIQQLFGQPYGTAFHYTTWGFFKIFQFLRCWMNIPKMILVTLIETWNKIYFSIFLDFTNQFKYEEIEEE